MVSRTYSGRIVNKRLLAPVAELVGVTGAEHADGGVDAAEAGTGRVAAHTAGTAVSRVTVATGTPAVVFREERHIVRNYITHIHNMTAAAPGF